MLEFNQVTRVKFVVDQIVALDLMSYPRVFVISDFGVPRQWISLLFLPLWAPELPR